jgi:hypothetical protein
MSDAPTTVTPTPDSTHRPGRASPPRPLQASALSASLAFAWRSLLKIKHAPSSWAT